MEGISAGSQVRPGQELGSEFGKGASQGFYFFIFFLGVDGVMGLVDSGGGGRHKQAVWSASSVLSWAALPPCLWFGRGFWQL